MPSIKAKLSESVFYPGLSLAQRCTRIKIQGQNRANWDFSDEWVLVFHCLHSLHRKI